MNLSQLWPPTLNFYQDLTADSYICTYSYHFTFGNCRVHWEVAPRQKSNLMWLQLSRFRFLYTPTEHTFLSFERFHNLREIILSQAGNDNKVLVTPKNDNTSVSASNGEVWVQNLFALFQCYSGRQLTNLCICLLQHNCSRGRSAKGWQYITHDCWRKRSRILCL